MNWNTSSRSSYCDFCKEKAKREFCPVALHVEGYLLSEICPTCKSKTKFIHCQRLDHSKNQALDVNFRGRKTAFKPKPQSRKPIVMKFASLKQTDSSGVQYNKKNDDNRNNGLPAVHSSEKTFRNIASDVQSIVSGDWNVGQIR